MNFEEVLACLENTDKREEFISRLKNAGENSTPCLHVQHAMVELKMNKAPRGIDEKTILQHTLKFTDSNECFQSFQLVCKSWKDAVETIKFNRFLPPEIFTNIDKIIKNGLSISPYFEKYLQCFKKVSVPLHYVLAENRHHMISLILNNMQKLNYINFYQNRIPLALEIVDPFIHQIVDPFVLIMLENSHETLQKVCASRFCIPDISFPKLKTLCVEIGVDICLPEFKTYFSLVLKNMERLQTVRMCFEFGSGSNDVCEYITKHYGKHCISASNTDIIEVDSVKMLNIVPVKILTDVDDLEENVQNCKYVSGLQYLHMDIYFSEEPMRYSWDKNQEILDQCLNLKAVELTWKDGEDFETISFSQISEVNQHIWQDRISYFRARCIRIVDEGEIHDNENLQTKLTKEAGVSWNFAFY